MVYNFNIVSYVQNYLGDEDNGLKPELDMMIAEGPEERMLYLKPMGSASPVKFILTYTDSELLSQGDPFSLYI